VPGSCPACSGGGGGGGAAKKPGPGLVGWDEAYALWHAEQLAKTRQADYLQASATQQERQQRAIQAQTIRALAQTLWTQFANNPPPFLVSVGTGAAQAFRSLAQLINTPQTLASFLKERLLQPVIDITDKLAILLGDAKKLLDDSLHHNNEMLKSLIAQLQWEERMAQVQSLMKRALGRFGTRKIFRGLEIRIQALFEAIKGLFGQSGQPDRD
jgi:hypothetical protein